jgi:YHS domain-containing protein
MKMLFSMFVTSIALPALVFAGEPVNEVCPFTGNPVNPEVTAQVGEDTVAFCCGGCLNGFIKWEDNKKAMYIAEQKAARVKAETALIVTTPYLLDTCPITGETFDSMSEPLVEVIDGREIRFCSAGCIPKFKANKEAKFKEIDAKMIAQQLPYYPIDTCVVSGDKLDAKGASVDFIYGNRLFRTCCNDCKDEFLADPAKFVPELDEAIIKAQKKTYPLTTCIIGKGTLDGMGGPDYMIVGNRLVQLCCAGCRPKVLADPLGAFALIEAGNK